MYILSIIFLWLLLSAITITALVLLLPIKYEIRLRYDTDTAISINATWFFGIVKFLCSYNNSKGSYELLILNKERNSKKRKPQKKRPVAAKTDPGKSKTESGSEKDQEKNIENENKREKKSNKQSKQAEVTTGESAGGIRRIVELPNKKQLLKATFTLAKRLLAALTPKRVKLNAVIGFDDPSLTGRLIGALAFFAGVNGIDMKLQGNFTGPEFKCNLELGGRIIIWEFVWPLIRYTLTAPVRKAIMQVLK